MKAAPLISVIVPVFNTENYLKNCLDSLRNQSYSNWEAILVDDGSTDSSGKICEDYSALDSRFRVFHKPNGGLSSARNRALDEACGGYIFMLDSDDFIHVDTFKILLELALKHDAEIVQTKFINGPETTFPEINQDDSYEVLSMRDAFTKLKVKVISCAKLYKNTAIGNVRFPEGLINEDDFTTWKFFYNTKTIILTERVLYYYTSNPKSIMSKLMKKPNLKFFDAYKERLSFFKDRKEPELEAVSRFQWLKSMVLVYCYPSVTEAEKQNIKECFKENYLELRKSDFSYPISFKVLFYLFNHFPLTASKIARMFR